VHMLEHGAIVVLHRPDLCDTVCLQRLGEFYDSAPRSTLVAIRHLAITPHQGWITSTSNPGWMRRHTAIYRYWAKAIFASLSHQSYLERLSAAQ